MYSKWYYFCFQFSPDLLFAVLKENVNFFNKVGKKISNLRCTFAFLRKLAACRICKLSSLCGLGIFAYIHLPGKGQDSLFHNEFGNCTCKRVSTCRRTSRNRTIFWIFYSPLLLAYQAIPWLIKHNFPTYTHQQFGFRFLDLRINLTWPLREISHSVSLR